MRKTTGVAVLAIAVCVAALVVFRTRDAPGGAPTTSWNEAVDQGPAEVMDGTPPSRPPAEQLQGVPATSEPRREEAAASIPRVRVKVIDADTGAPVAGATVTAGRLWWPGGRPGAAPKPEPSSTEPPAIPLTDGHGETEFACTWTGVVMQATTPSGLFGREAFREIVSQPLVVNVRRDLTLRVKVENRYASTPVGNVPVSLGQVEGGRWNSRHLPRHLCRTEPTSGIAEFRHVQDWLSSAAGAGRAWIDIPLRHQASVAVTEQDANGQPVVLQLPDTGSVVVRVVGERSGRPMVGVKIKVAAYVDAKTARPMRCSSGWGKGTTDRNGEARVGSVGTGLWVSAWPIGSPPDTRKDRSEGPRVDGEERHIVVRMSEDRHRLHGRVVTADGEPWQRTLLRIEAHSDGRLLTPITGLLGTTDEEGRFELQAGWEDHAELTITTIATQERPEPKAWLRLGPATDPGPIDVGVVVLDQGPILAAGSVVWARDDSPTEARVTVTAVDRSGAALGIDQLAGSRGSTEEGRFLVRAACGCDVAGGRVRIAVGGAGIVDTEVHGPAGRTDWVVKVHKLGVVKGRLQLEGDVVPSECVLLIRRGSHGYGTAQIDESGRFTFTDIPAGTYVVTAKLDSERHLGRDWEPTRVSIPGIVVADDVTTEDPRLDGVRLSSAFPLTEVRVTSELGGAVKGAAVRVDENMAAQLLPTTDAEGRVRLRLRMPMKILVTGPGFEPWIGDATPGVTSVVLTPAR